MSILFHNARTRKRRERAATGLAGDFLLRHAAESLVESMQPLTYAFPTILELGASGHLAPLLQQRTGTERVITCDIAATPAAQLVVNNELLPLAPESIDAAVSAGGLHFVNDLPGVLAQLRAALKPDGLFMATFPGPDTLRELRQVFAQIDAQQTGGITPRIAPFPDVRDAGGLLQRTGYALPVVDRELITVTYPDMFALMRELRLSGQVNMLHEQRSNFTPRRFFMAAAEHYAERFADAAGGIVATFELVTWTAWKPAANQQQPARRGSGQVSLKDVLN